MAKKLTTKPVARRGKINPAEAAKKRKAHAAKQKQRKAARGLPGRKKVASYRRNLGPMGPLGWDVIIEVTMAGNLSALKVPELNNTQVRLKLDQIVYRPLAEYLRGPDITMGQGGGMGMIQKYAPRDTGELRDSLIAGIVTAKTTLNNFPTSKFLMELGTPDVEYAKVVNQMPQSWLRHPKQKPKRRNQVFGRRGDQLNDPEARMGWYNLILLNGRNKARTLWDQYRSNIVGIMAPLKKANINPHNMFDQMFKARFK